LNNQKYALCETGRNGRRFIPNYSFGLSSASKEVEVNPCTGYRTATCLNGGTCILKSNKRYSCTCEPLFTGKNCEISVGLFCDDNQCSPNGNCIDQATGYKCVCDEGYTGNNCEIKCPVYGSLNSIFCRKQR
jgi:hypothetical protein